jgi:predicted DNA-binding transcriptional regulator|tara:strand:+ start:2519 stop:2647 length:129 start_codon:yes stop_codon:yes gene_type:complete
MRLIEVGGVYPTADPMEILEKLEKILDKQIKKSKKQLRGDTK